MINGITFNEQLIASADISHAYWVFSGKKSGVTRGCEITYSGSNLYVAAGYMFSHGRLSKVSGTETVAAPTVATGTLYCRLVYEVDLSKTNTETVFNQGYFKVLQGASDYPTLTQEDLDGTGTVYQIPFARFLVTVDGISSLVDERELVSAVIDDMQENIGSLGNAIGMRGWNQLVQNGDFADTNCWTSRRSTLTVASNVGTLTPSSSATNDNYSQNEINGVIGHKYLFSGEAKAYEQGVEVFVIYTGTASDYVEKLSTAENVWEKFSEIYTCTGTEINCVRLEVPTTDTSKSNQFRNVMLIDLTALFGSGNEPSTVAEFRAMFPADYYPYCSGSFADLLWTNSSPTSSFSAQTISLDLANYNFALVWFKLSTSSQDNNIYSIGGIGNSIIPCISIEINYWRPVSFSTSSVAFSDAKKQTAIGSGSVDNTYLIPYKIYGIR